MILYQEKDYFREVEEINKEHFPPFRRDYARVIHCASFRRLQGKTQIFPCCESEFFRNRLTHTLEVVQVAKSIAMSLNKKYSISIDTDLVETVALCHDIGHPPFGHNGERALNLKMLKYGGFEGNAQTLRVLTRIEKKVRQKENSIDFGVDSRSGLNLTYRALASLIKYDKEIPSYIVNVNKQPIKGYYFSEKPLIERIKKHIFVNYKYNDYKNKTFKTLECSIMDIADDIAYSTYDIEDAFKGGFLDPISMVNVDQDFLEKICHYAANNKVYIEVKEARNILREIFEGFISFNSGFKGMYQSGKELAESGYLRTQFTSSLVHYCISNVSLKIDFKCPLLSKVFLPESIQKRVEILKLFVYFSVINSPKMNIVRYQGREIIYALFDILIKSQPETSLLPEDVGELFYAYDVNDLSNRSRVISDYISSMTDRYAMDLYSRFKSDVHKTIFKLV